MTTKKPGATNGAEQTKRKPATTSKAHATANGTSTDGRQQRAARNHAAIVDAVYALVRETGETDSTGLVHDFASKEHPTARPPTLRLC